MSGLIDWIQLNEAAIKAVFTVVIGFVSLVIAGKLIIKAITAAGKSQMKDVTKNLGFAALVIIIAAVGIGGMFALINRIAPDDSILPRASAVTTTAVIQPYEGGITV